jgi:hypothetical protein
MLISIEVMLIIIIIIIIIIILISDSSVGIATDYGFDSWQEQTGSEAHPISYPLGTGGSFPGGETARA